jgi:hypothetical protein
MFTLDSVHFVPDGVLQSLGPLAEPPALLIGLVLLAAILIVGRIVMAIAWRLLLIAIGVVVGLWVLSLLGFQTGIL